VTSDEREGVTLWFKRPQPRKEPRGRGEEEEGRRLILSRDGVPVRYALIPPFLSRLRSKGRDDRFEGKKKSTVPLGEKRHRDYIGEILQEKVKNALSTLPCI
jgi:hypothetical protein